MSNKERKKKKPILKTILLIVFLALCATLGFAVWNVFDSLKPVQTESEIVEFEVGEGASVTSLTNQLEAAGIIKNAKIAYYYVRMNNLGDLKAGKFRIDKSWDLEKIFTTLNDQSAIIIENVPVTIIEGDWAKDIAYKISQTLDNVTYEDLIALWSDHDWLTSVMDDYPFLTESIFDEDIRIPLEGYLAPETYYFDIDMNAEEATRMILDQTLTVFNQFKEQIEASEYTRHQIYTLASIIQYEAGTKEEDLKLIAGVFFNRLKIDMALQSSVTVCYAIDFDKENDTWQACEVNSQFDSPYNTYMYPGLPPGPIENPGVKALEAVLNPTESNYYYFMADVYGDGTVYYAETLEEHNQNVAKYLGQ